MTYVAVPGFAQDLKTEAYEDNYNLLFGLFQLVLWIWVKSFIRRKNYPLLPSYLIHQFQCQFRMIQVPVIVRLFLYQPDKLPDFIYHIIIRFWNDQLFLFSIPSVNGHSLRVRNCLLYTSDAADD